MAKGRLEPLYLVTGDDEAEMSALASALVQVVDEDFRAFNVQRFYGSDNGTTMAMVCDAASTFPLLSSKRVVILQQAEKVLVSRRSKAADIGDDGESAAEPTKGSDHVGVLKQYAENPFDHAVVAIMGTGLDKTFQPFAKQAAIVVCELSTDVIGELEREHGVRFDRQAAEMLRQRAGADLGRLRADVERVFLFAAGKTTVTKEHVEAVTGKASASNNLWLELANRRTASALRELALELEAGGVPFMMLGLIRSVVDRTVGAKDLPFAVDALMRTDLALKTSGGDPRVLLERLIVEVCSLRRE